jgi:hypothetical protein
MALLAVSLANEQIVDPGQLSHQWRDFFVFPNEIGSFRLV